MNSVVITREDEIAQNPNFVVRLSRKIVYDLCEVIDRHPLKPTLRSTIERAIVLMIEDLEEEIRRGQ